MKTIQTVTIDEIVQGKNWRDSPRNDQWTEETIECAELVETEEFDRADQVIYSAVIEFPSGLRRGLLMFKIVGDAAYSGVYWELVGGRWRRVGIEPDPEYEVGGAREFVSKPLPNDPFFDSADRDVRAEHRDGFRSNVAGLFG